MLVVFTDNKGKESQMQKRYAEILQKLKRGTFQEIQTAPAVQNPELEELPKLRAEADALGIEYHHRAGVAKLRELLGK